MSLPVYIMIINPQKMSLKMPLQHTTVGYDYNSSFGSDTGHT